MTPIRLFCSVALACSAVPQSAWASLTRTALSPRHSKTAPAALVSALHPAMLLGDAPTLGGLDAVHPELQPPTLAGPLDVMSGDVERPLTLAASPAASDPGKGVFQNLESMISASPQGGTEPTRAGAVDRGWVRLLNWSAKPDDTVDAPAVTVVQQTSRLHTALQRPVAGLKKMFIREPALDAVIASYRGKVRLAAFLKVAGAGLMLLNAKLIGALVQSAGAHETASVVLLTALSTVTLISAIPLRHWSDMLQGKAAAGVVEDLRRTVFSRLLEVASFRSGGATPGVLASRVKDDPNAVEQIGVRLPVRKLAAMFTLAASSILLYTLHPAAAAIVLGAFGAVSLLGAAYGRVTRELFDGYQRSSADLNAHLVDVFTNADTVLSYGKKQGETQRLHMTLGAIKSILLEGVKIGARWRSWEEVIAVPLAFPGAFVIAMIVGLPVASAIMVAFYASYVYGALGELTDISALTQQHSGAITEISRLLASAKPSDFGAPAGIIAGEVQADAMSFFYDAGRRVLDELSFRISPASLTVIAGPSGSGKTTLLRIIAGLDRPRSGRLLIDGIEAHLLSAEQWRQQIGYVPQDSGLMAGTVRENLRYGKPYVSDAEIAQALRAFGADFLLNDATRFPQGIDTPVGPHGAGLSGGQAQLVALVRALLNGPRLLILDEPTAAMDAQTEAKILGLLQDLRSGKFGPAPTIILVSHRPSAFKAADRVLWLKGG